jgi:hypothetical protein
MSRDDAAVFVFDTWGDPEQAARDISLAVEAHSRGFVYVRPHLRGWPRKGNAWQRRKNRRRAT